MVEVFKTDVKEKMLAKQVVKEIHQLFLAYSANFDLEDCDCILRVENKKGDVSATEILKLLRGFGIDIEVLEDKIAVSQQSI